jgi:hypothetical protein
MNGSSARKLLERMRSTSSGWGQADFERLFTGFGFDSKGKKHTIYFHPQFPDLVMGVPRHNKLKEWVARDAVKLIDELIVRSEKNEVSNGPTKQDT